MPSTEPLSASARGGENLTLGAADVVIRTRGPQGHADIPAAPCRVGLTSGELSYLRHPAERSRLVLALAVTLFVCGLMGILLVKALQRDQVFITVAIGIVVAGFTWGALQILRARLLGGAVRVTSESLPEVHRLLEDAREQLDYRKRVDVYVSTDVDGLAMLTNFLGVRLILLEGDLVATLLREGKQRELAFIIARFVGALKAKHERLAPIRVLLAAVRPLGLVGLLLWPYERAVVYSGDQIGMACCADLEAALAALDRLMVGGLLASDVQERGVLAQAAEVRHRRLPRLAELLSRQPHLTSRYVNLLCFAERYCPEERQRVVAAMTSDAERDLSALASRSPHRSWDPRRRRALAPVLGIATVSLTLSVAVLLLPAGPASEQDISGQQSPDLKAALELAAHVPPAFAGTCTPAKRTGDQVEDGLSAGVLCTAAAPAVVEYYQYGSKQAMYRAFEAIAGGVPRGECEGKPGRGRYFAGDPSQVAGQRACWVDEQGASVIAWTDDAKRIIGYATAGDMRLVDLVRWWGYDSGPY
jgi:hypothetical protein